MGKCAYCGKDAGLLHKFHKECQERYDNALSQMSSLAADAIHNGTSLPLLEFNLTGMATSGLVPLKKALVEGWERAVTRALDDGVLSHEEETRLVDFKDHFQLSQDDLNTQGAYIRVVQNAVLRDVLEGNPQQQRVQMDSSLPFNLLKSESLVWAFDQVKYYEQRTQRSYTGGYQGVSIRVARGIYYRTGGFRGHPVETAYMQYVGIGMLGVTTKQLYFTAGMEKSFRVRYDKIVSILPYSDGVIIQRDAATAKPQAFVTGDGWFISNLLTNLAQM
jgi:hypothetical protein